MQTIYFILNYLIGIILKQIINDILKLKVLQIQIILLPLFLL
jgi:hypothetical protein